MSHRVQGLGFTVQDVGSRVEGPAFNEVSSSEYMRERNDPPDDFTDIYGPP